MAEPGADTPSARDAKGEAPPTLCSDQASPIPSVQVHLLERPGSTREARRGPPFHNRRRRLAKVSPEKPSEPSKGSAPRAHLNCERD